jgi:2'-hydroxyisoflavone reductase
MIWRIFILFSIHGATYLMHILILGGTRFLGRYIVEAALAAGHEVTLFNRGKSNPGLFPQVETLNGDRRESAEALKGRRWDACIDTSGYIPREVRMSAEALRESVAHYTFISTISVYSDALQPGADESGPLVALADPTVEEVTGETYGGLKVLCEQAAEAALPGRVLTVRSGLIVGPHDPTDRFTYWVARAAEGGPMLAPGDPEQGLQFIDVRDQAGWLIRMTEARTTGIFNLSGPAYRLTMREVLETCVQVTNAGTALTWVEEAFLLEQGIQPWAEVPLWIPAQENASLNINLAKAQAAGLTCRPLAQTVQDTHAWHQTRADGFKRALTPEREAAVLAARRAWQSRT